MTIRWPWRRGEPEDVRRARAAAEQAGERLADARRKGPEVHRQAERIRRIARENNLAPMIMRALGARE